MDSESSEWPAGPSVRVHPPWPRAVSLRLLPPWPRAVSLRLLRTGSDIREGRGERGEGERGRSPDQRE